MTATKHSMNKKLYAEIKPQLKTSADDAKVMKKYGYSQSTVRKIRNTKDWHDYEARTHRFDGYPRKNKPVMVHACSNEIPPEGEVKMLEQILKNVQQENVDLRMERDKLIAERERVLKEQLMDLDLASDQRAQAVGLIWALVGAILGALITAGVVALIGARS